VQKYESWAAPKGCATVHQFEKGLELEREMELDDLVPWVGFLLSRFPIVAASGI
jgi:hypothetical protein